MATAEDDGGLASDEVATSATPDTIDEGVATGEDGDSAELTTAELPSDPAQTKLILCVSVPESIGALKSHVVTTYGQQILPPTTAISPLTNTSVLTVSAPTFAPLMSKNWKLVPAYVPEQPWQSGEVRVSHVTRESELLRVAACTFWWLSVEE